MFVQHNKLAIIHHLCYTFKMDNYTVYFDGSCWPNPGGCAAYGSVVEKAGVTICEEAGVVDTSPLMSNNVAEFIALAVGLRRLRESSPERGVLVSCYGDSQLVINIMNKKWRPSPDKLYYPAWEKADEEAQRLRFLGATLTYQWIPREQNTRCDDLSKAHNHSPK